MAGVIADASPLIALDQIGQISLIKHLFGQILIPSAVAREVSPSLPTLPAWIMTRDLTQPIASEILQAAGGRIPSIKRGRGARAPRGCRIAVRLPA